MPWGVHDIDAITIPLKCRVFVANGDSLFTFEVHRIHDSLLDFLVCAESSRLPQQLIDKGGLAVIDVRNDGNVADFIHAISPESEERRILWETHSESNA